MEGKERINEICTKVPSFTELFNAHVRHYYIKEHTLNVFNQFEKYFSENFSKSKIEEFRLFLLLHDIGKSLAYEQGNRSNQYNATINIIQKRQTELGISDESFVFYDALLSASCIGKYMEKKASLDGTFATISTQSRKSRLPIKEFFYFLSVYYQCDIASYTRDAGGIAYLENLFEYQNEFKVYNNETNLLKFSDLFAQRYNLLYDKINKSSETSIIPDEKNVRSLSTQDIYVKVVGKIDLSKFERPKKELKQDLQNYYVIDTNVFVSCPEVISKVDPKYPVILSAKVVDELDKLKMKLDDAGKSNVQKALRSINQCMDSRNVKMILADMSILPDDFDKRSPDNMILTVALKFKNENPILLTSDNGLQVKAKGLGITTITLKEFLRK